MTAPDTNTIAILFFNVLGCLLLLSILAAGAVTKGTLRLYFAAQLVATVAEYGWRHSEYYALVYALATMLMVEISVFLLWDAGIGAMTWREAWIAGIWMAVVGAFSLGRLSLAESYLLAEGLLFAILGMAMMLLAKKSPPLLPLGTLNWAMAGYDFLYLVRPGIRVTNWLAEPIMCSAAFLWLAAKQRRKWVTV